MTEVGNPAGAAIWARLDARSTPGDETTAATRVGGLSLLGRHLRLLARAGFAGAEVLVGSDDDRRLVEAVLARDPAPAALTIDVVGVGTGEAPARPDRRVVTLAVRAIHGRDALLRARDTGAPPPPLCEVLRTGDVRRALAVLMAGLRKTMAHDGFVAFYVMRPLSGLMARALVGTAMTPNQVTLVALLFGLTGGALAATGGVGRTALAGLFVWVGALIDCVDGDLARLRLQGSRLGQWLDTLADDLTTFGLLVGLGVGLHRDGAGPPWLAVGVLGALLWAMTEAKVYRDLHRLGLPIDTAQFPWFFGDPSQAPAPDAGLVARAVYAIGFLFKRDAFITFIALALFFDLRRIALCVLAAGSVVMFALVLVHAAVMAVRGKGAPRG